MKLKSFIRQSGLLLAIVAMSQFVAAQHADTEPELAAVNSALPDLDVAGSEPDSDDTIDEITVMGRRSFMSMRRDIERADDRLFEIFNSLNDDDEYDVICKMETSGGTRTKSRLC